MKVDPVSTFVELPAGSVAEWRRTELSTGYELRLGISLAGERLMVRRHCVASDDEDQARELLAAKLVELKRRRSKLG